LRSVIYLQYTKPAAYPPVEHSGLILLKAGWDVHYLGVQSEGESNKLAFPEPLAQRQTLCRWTPPGWRQKIQFVRFTLAAVWRAIRRRPDWVYCSDMLSCPAGWLIRRLTRCRVLYHEHDSPSLEEGAGSGERGAASMFQRYLLSLRCRLGREADLVILPNQRRLDLFQVATGRQKPSLCVFNCPRKEEVGPQRVPLPRGARLRLAFHGSINGDRLPMALLPALACFRGMVELQIVGYTTVGSSDYLEGFLAEAKRLGIGGMVEYCGALPSRQDLLASSAKCNVGLAFMPLHGGDVNMAHMTGASNKPFDYLACGVALLVSARPDWEEMFVRPGYGLACNPTDAESIAAQLRWFVEHPSQTREMGGRGQNRVLNEWNYECQFAPILAELENGHSGRNT
jgi:glycosyltransferase involved in cell wall biosynthesis